MIGFTSQEDWGKEYLLIVPVDRHDLELAGISSDQVDMLTDEDLKAIVFDMLNRYVAHDFYRDLWCAALIVLREREKTMPPKNPCGKTVKPENAYEVWQSLDGTWTYYVLRKYQLEEKAKDNPYARYYCFVTSPSCPREEYGDVYRTTVLNGNHQIANPLCTDKQTTGGENHETHTT